VNDTGSPGAVPDEASFIESIRACIDSRRATGRSLPILLIETGVIRGIDDVWGHQFGNAVRDRVAAALRTEVLRLDDPLAEIGRGKLACALTAVSDPTVVQLAAEKSLRVLSMPFLIDEDEIYARPAVGIAIWPTHGDDAETLLQRASTAALAARSLPSHVATYSVDQIDSMAAQFLYENRLRSAVTDDTLDMLFQPQYDLRRGNIWGAEGILRARDPRLDRVDNSDAFNAAEAAGLSAQLVSAMLNRVLRNCSEFRYSAGLDLRVAINLPARILAMPELPDLIERALNTWNLRAGRLALEISETAMLRSHTAACEMLSRLNEMNVRLAIDDPHLTVGALYWMSGLPFKSLKIDVTEATDLGMGPEPPGITKSLIELGHRLKLDVFAIGVADAAAEARLTEAGCDYMQSDTKGPALDAIEFVNRYMV
jgi:diguanylate cyclase (GGDEF)-like protein